MDGPVDATAARDALIGLWRSLGFAPGTLGDSVVPTPDCGLAGSSPGHVRRVLSALRDIGRALTDPD